MIQLFKQTLNNGDKVLVKIKGDNKREIIRQLWSFVNRGVVKIKKGVEIEDDTGLNWLTDFEGYFRTTEKELKTALNSISLFKILQEIDPNYELDNIPYKLEEKASEIGEEWFNSIPEENVLRLDPFVENE
jgi:hypothetical protein